MPRLVSTSILFVALLGGCTAVDNFDKFTFVDAGTLPGFGQACMTDCAQPNPLRPLMCYHMFGSRNVPGGMCTRSCTASLGPLACSDFPDAACVTVEGMDVCLLRCDPSIGRNCRNNYSCCANHTVVTGPGTCAPTESDVCH
jgi:hypothetical protein